MLPKHFRVIEVLRIQYVRTSSELLVQIFSRFSGACLRWQRIHDLPSMWTWLNNCWAMYLCTNISMKLQTDLTYMVIHRLAVLSLRSVFMFSNTRGGSSLQDIRNKSFRYIKDPVMNNKKWSLLYIYTGMLHCHKHSPSMKTKISVYVHNKLHEPTTISAYEKGYKRLSINLPYITP